MWEKFWWIPLKRYLAQRTGLKTPSFINSLATFRTRRNKKKYDRVLRYRCTLVNQRLRKLIRRLFIQHDSRGLEHKKLLGINTVFFFWNESEQTGCELVSFTVHSGYRIALWVRLKSEVLNWPCHNKWQWPLWVGSERQKKNPSDEKKLSRGGLVHNPSDNSNS